MITGGGDETPAGAAGGVTEFVLAAGGGIEGSFGGPGIAGKAFVGGVAAGEGATEPAGFAVAGGAGGFAKPAAGRVGSVAGRAAGPTFGPAGAGVVLPAALLAVGGFGGAGGSLGGMNCAS